MPIKARRHRIRFKLRFIQKEATKHRNSINKPRKPWSETAGRLSAARAVKRTSGDVYAKGFQERRWSGTLLNSPLCRSWWKTQWWVRRRKRLHRSRSLSDRHGCTWGRTAGRQGCHYTVCGGEERYTSQQTFSHNLWLAAHLEHGGWGKRLRKSQTY